MRIRLIEYKDLNIVEFAVGETDGECVLCSENSRYLHGSVFTLFQSAFLLSNNSFDYFGKSRFADSSLTSLRNHLQDYLARVEQIQNTADLERFILKQVEGIDFMNELKTYYPDWRIKWERFKNELRIVLREIIEIVDDCIDEDKVFWIKGY